MSSNANLTLPEDHDEQFQFALILIGQDSCFKHDILINNSNTQQV